MTLNLRRFRECQIFWACINFLLLPSHLALVDIGVKRVSRSKTVDCVRGGPEGKVGVAAQRNSA